jgi:hypothetical protein
VVNYLTISSNIKDCTRKQLCVYISRLLQVLNIFIKVEFVTET